ncbi:MAG: tRNA 2-thiouridine(34) synthase MnmA [Synergistaceae bacterium]|jgi:tRNA-specific 2-thiouridylase|nr:tRNA 2-thiouridine(34) synthase MnmA [Synergistaceae bacterium]
MKSVLLGMSGGVDSGVSAALLLDEGYDVVPLHLLMTDEDEEAQARRERLCRRLGLALRTRDIRQEFSRSVFKPFIDAYRNGLTPNPCVWCNERVKFHALEEERRSRGYDHLATGHYARMVLRQGQKRIARAADQSKDQSYVLYRLGKEIRENLIFPLGKWTKSGVLGEAFRRFGDLFRDVRESRDLCFLTSGERKRLLAGKPGPIVDRQGCFLGEHRGLGLYTVGQRKGLGLSGGPWTVAAIDVGQNRLVVTRPEEIPPPGITATSPFWHRQLQEGEILLAQHRYRTVPRKVLLQRLGADSFDVTYVDCPQLSVPGQSLVLYEEDCLVGGGIMEKTRKEAKA